MRAAAILLYLQLQASAADPTEMWHTIDPSWMLGRVQLNVHTQFRWRLDDGKRYPIPRPAYFRTGPMVQIPYRGLIVHGGYWFQESQGRTSLDWEDSQRVFAGGERPLSQNWSTRGLWEYFFGTTRPNFHRYRQAIRFAREREGWTPVGSCEVFFDRAGAAALRPLAGLRHAIGTKARFEAGYFYDWRRRDVGGSRHVIFTILRLQFRQ